MRDGLRRFIGGAVSTRAVLGGGVLATLALLLAALPTAAQAEEAPASRTWEERSGPYDLRVDMTPAVPNYGGAHLDVTVLDAATGDPVRDATVRILARGPESASEGEGWAVAFTQPDTPGVYSADVLLDAAGPWAMSVEVRGAQGEGFMAFSVDVPTANRSTLGLGVFGLVLLFFVFAAWRVWLESRKMRRQRAARRTLQGPSPQAHG